MKQRQEEKVNHNQTANLEEEYKETNKILNEILPEQKDLGAFNGNKTSALRPSKQVSLKRRSKVSTVIHTKPSMTGRFRNTRTLATSLNNYKSSQPQPIRRKKSALKKIG